MNRYIDSRIITLNSKYSVKNNSTYNSNVWFNMNILKDEHDIIQTDIQLINAQIPISFYNINYTCNVLNYIAGLTNKTITFPKGNYTTSLFLSTLQSQFSANGDNITVSYNQTTGFLTFTGTITFTFLYLNSTMFRVLGFSDLTNYTSSSNSLTAPNPFNLSTITQLSISSDTLITHSFSSSTVSNILATISVDKPPYSYLMYNLSNSTMRNILRNYSIDAISIKIKDEYGSFINFNNQDWNLTFSINVLRNYLGIPKPLFKDLIKDNPTPKENLNTLEKPDNSNTLENQPIDPELNLLSQ
jgi:hypothetical protein